jgi:hypothetical protein
MNHKHVLHCFMPGQTIEAVIRLKGGHGLAKAEVLQLVEVFNQLNGTPLVRPGMTLKIPLPLQLESDSEGGLID